MKVLDTDNNFLSLDNKYSNYNDSKIVIIQAPYEHTVSYGGGTKLGPNAIIKSSQYVEFYDDETEKEICFKNGIATLEEIDFKGAIDKNALDIIQSQISDCIQDGKFVVTLGGEHTISSAPIAAHLEKYPNMSVLQFDAHSDLRDTYEDSKYSHACIMARVAEFMNSKKNYSSWYPSSMQRRS